MCCVSCLFLFPRWYKTLGRLSLACSCHKCNVSCCLSLIICYWKWIRKFKYAKFYTLSKGYKSYTLNNTCFHVFALPFLSSANAFAIDAGLIALIKLQIHVAQWQLQYISFTSRIRFPSYVSIFATRPSIFRFRWATNMLVLACSGILRELTKRWTALI